MLRRMREIIIYSVVRFFLQTPSMTHSRTMCEWSEMKISFLRNKFSSNGRHTTRQLCADHKWIGDYLFAGVLVSKRKTECHRCCRLLSFDGYLHLMRYSIFQKVFTRTEPSFRYREICGQIDGQRMVEAMRGENVITFSDSKWNESMIGLLYALMHSMWSVQFHTVPIEFRTWYGSNGLNAKLILSGIGKKCEFIFECRTYDASKRNETLPFSLHVKSVCTIFKIDEASNITKWEEKKKPIIQSSVCSCER